MYTYRIIYIYVNSYIIKYDPPATGTIHLSVGGAFLCLCWSSQGPLAEMNTLDGDQKLWDDPWLAIHYLMYYFDQIGYSLAHPHIDISRVFWCEDADPLVEMNIHNSTGYFVAEGDGSGWTDKKNQMISGDFPRSNRPFNNGISPLLCWPLKWS